MVEALEPRNMLLKNAIGKIQSEVDEVYKFCINIFHQMLLSLSAINMLLVSVIAFSYANLLGTIMKRSCCRSNRDRVHP